MSITGPGSITAANVTAQNNLFNQLNQLSVELATGEAAQTYAGLGSQAGVAASLSSQITAFDGYATTATSVGTTLTLAQSVLTQLGDAGTSVEKAIGQQGNFALDNTGQTSTQESAANYLDEITSLLNTQAGSNYLFSGEAVTTPSVATSSDILNGTGTQAGLTQVIAERLQADQGANGLGRLVIPAVSGSSVSISEDAAGSPFGFKLASVSSSLTGATVTGPSGSPASISVSLGSNPNAGDSIAFDLTLPDGSTQTIRCKRPRLRRPAPTSSPSAQPRATPRAICRPRSMVPFPIWRRPRCRRRRRWLQPTISSARIRRSVSADRRSIPQPRWSTAPPPIRCSGTPAKMARRPRKTPLPRKSVRT
jgi:flagellar hook-associated protein 3 FlgL